ncbi:hypothetical protein [Azospirillum halopraeferens]|nr:hypothetical protein [Azospirillum halopraeferens]
MLLFRRPTTPTPNITSQRAMHIVTGHERFPGCGAASEVIPSASD